MALYLDKVLKNGARIAVWEVAETESELLEIISIPKEELDELLYTKNSTRIVEQDF